MAGAFVSCGVTRLACITPVGLWVRCKAPLGVLREHTGKQRKEERKMEEEKEKTK
jgi:hypothetical protein